MKGSSKGFIIEEQYVEGSERMKESILDHLELRLKRLKEKQEEVYLKLYRNATCI